LKQYYEHVIDLFPFVKRNLVRPTFVISGAKHHLTKQPKDNVMRTKTLSIAGAALAGLLTLTGLQTSAQAFEIRPDTIRWDDHHDWRNNRFFFDFFLFDQHRHHDHDRRSW
jgi:hypothetical protein